MQQLLQKDKRIKCIQCNEYPGFVTTCRDGDEVYSALECNCKRTSFMRSRSFVVAEWQSSTYKLTPEEAKKVEGPVPFQDKTFAYGLQ